MEDTTFYDHEMKKQRDMEQIRHDHMIELELTRAKLETVRLAKEVLLEVSRNKPVDMRDIKAEDITSFAEILLSQIKK